MILTQKEGVLILLWNFCMQILQSTHIVLIKLKYLRPFETEANGFINTLNENVGRWQGVKFAPFLHMCIYIYIYIYIYIFVCVCVYTYVEVITVSRQTFHYRPVQTDYSKGIICFLSTEDFTIRNKNI
jgi:hypothetical protein